MRFKALTCLFCAVCGILSSGCSFLFVKSPPANAEKLPPTEPVDCTTSQVAPAIDALIAGFQVVRTGYAVSQSESDYVGAPIKRSADIALGAGLTVVFVAAAAYGFAATGECSDVRDAQARRRRKLKRPPAVVRTAPTSSEDMSAPATPVPVQPPETETPSTPPPPEEAPAVPAE